METQIPESQTSRERSVMSLIVICAVFGATLVYGMWGLAGAVPNRYSGIVSWYIVPVLFVAIGLLLAKVTNLLPAIRLIGPGLCWRTACLFVALAVLAPLVENLLILAGARILAPQLLGQISRGTAPTGQIIRSLVGSPIGEETLMRGWMLTWLNTHLKAEYRVFGCTITAANLLTSLTFAGIHVVNGINALTPVRVLVIIPIALLLGRARERTGGLLLPMIVHSIVNFVG